MRFLHRIHYNSPVILTFSLCSLAVLLLDFLTGGLTTNLFFCVYRSPLLDPLTYVRMVGHVLGHSGYAHYINNVLLLLVVGPPLEEKYGGAVLLRAIFFTALISGVVQWAFFPGSALLGASGIVFMLIVLSSLAGMKEGGIPLTLILVLLFYVGGEILSGLTLVDNVSQLTHVIGGACGAATGFLELRRRD